MDTIFALASAPGKAGVSVIRISGADAFDVVHPLVGSLPEPRRTGLRALCSRQGDLIDQALVICFEQGASFTGERSVELHLHGSTAIVTAVLREIGLDARARLAEPGEFTRRALENGCLDLAQVEGLADLIDSETEAQRRQAMRVFSGEIGTLTDVWRKSLIRAAALIEATIDFADEDVPVDVTPEVRALLSDVQAEIRKQIRGASAAERVRNGFEVAIVGAPNVGKSTLLNALAGREAAITSEFAGTTRDVIEVRMDIAGLPVTLLDTAGLRDTEDFVEGIGITKAIARAETADIRLFLVEKGEEPPIKPLEGDLVLVAKADLHGDLDGAVSGVSGQGIENLLDLLRIRLAALSANAGIAVRERHRFALEKADLALTQALWLVELGSEVSDLAAEEIRTAARALDQLVGRIDVENLLDEIFSSFCIGK